MKTERLAASCVQKRRYFFCTACKPSTSGLNKVNANAFRLNFFVLFEIKTAQKKVPPKYIIISSK
jgi:hypothetical protein